MGRPKGSKNGVVTPNDFYVVGRDVFLDVGRCLFAVIDADDYHLVKHLRWGAHIEKNGTIYAYSNGIKGIQEPVKLHRFLAGIPGLDVDHRDRDGLNCRRLNLRVATRTQNNANRISQPNSTSKFKGVTWDRKRNQWKALIQVSGKSLNLGRFNGEADAAAAYNLAAREAFGEFARLNTI